MTISLTERTRGEAKLGTRGPLARRSAEALLWRILTALVFAVVALLLVLPPAT